MGPEQELLRSFVEAVEAEYSKQNSSQGSMAWEQIQFLSKKLIALKTLMICKGEFKTFIDSLLQYIELALCFISNCQNMEYKKQRKYALRSLGLIPMFFQNTDIKNYFIQEATVKTLELFIHGDYTTVSKKELIKMFNSIAVTCQKEVRSNTAKNILYYMYKLMDTLPTYGDYQMQADIVEALFRIFGQEIKTGSIKYELLPGYQELGNALKNISITNFDAEVRQWLNKLNENSEHIFSIVCKTLMFGTTICKSPVGGPEDMWVDFDLKQNIMSFFTTSLKNEDTWNPVLILAKDVKKVEVKRQLRSKENVTIISMHLLKPCISELSENQEYWNTLDKHVQMVISNDEKEKIIKVISYVLPRVFGDTFSHASARISDEICNKKKQLYKPLGIKISKKKSIPSDLSSVTSKSRSDTDVVAQHGQANNSATRNAISPVSKSMTDESSIPEIKKSRAIPDYLSKDYVSWSVTSKSKSDINAQNEQTNKSATRNAISPVSKSMTDDSSIPEIKKSKAVPDYPSRDYVSWTMTDFTRPSSRHTDNSEVFSSRATSPDLLEEVGYWQKQDGEKVQDNIVTSSIITEAEAHVSHVPGSPADEIVILQGSEVFSSSPIKMSRPIIEFSEEDFHSVASEDVEQTRPDNVHAEKETLSVFKMSEDLLEFETALENFEVETCKENALRFKEQQLKSHGEIDNVTSKSISAEETVESNISLKKLNDIDRATSDFEEVADTKKTITEPEPLKQIPSKDKESNEDSITELRQRTPDPRVDTTSVIESSEQIPDVNENSDTQDTFDRTTQDNRPSHEITEENSYSLNNSQDIFSRPTQEWEIIPEPVQTTQDDFPELSLAVNVGISEQPYSQEIVPNVKLQARVDVVQNAAASDEEDIIDLTGDEKNPVEKSKDSEIHQKEPCLNTPDLLNILAGDVSQSQSLKGSGDQTKKKSNMECVSSEEEIPARKKKPRTLIKTGKKKFHLDEEVTTKTDPVQIAEDNNCKVIDEDTSKIVGVQENMIEECDKPDTESVIKPKRLNTKKYYFESDDDICRVIDEDTSKIVGVQENTIEECDKPDMESVIKPKRLNTKKYYFESDDDTELPKQHDPKQIIKEINKEIPTSDFIPKKLFIKCNRNEAAVPIKQKKLQKPTKNVNKEIDNINVATDSDISTSEANKENTIVNSENKEERFPKKKKKLRKSRDINNKQFDLDDDDESTLKPDTVISMSEVGPEAEEALCELSKSMEDQTEKKSSKRKKKSVRTPNKKAKQHLDLHDDDKDVELYAKKVPVQNEAIQVAKEVVLDQHQGEHIEEEPTGKTNFEVHRILSDIDEYDFSVNEKKREGEGLISVLNDHAELNLEQESVQNMEDSDSGVVAGKVIICEAVVHSQREHFEERCSGDRDVVKLTTQHDVVKNVEANYSDDNSREMARNGVIQEVEVEVYGQFQSKLVEDQSSYNTNIRQSKRLLQKTKTSKESLDEIQVVKENNSNPPTRKTPDWYLTEEATAVNPPDVFESLLDVGFKREKSPDFRLIARQSSPILTKNKSRKPAETKSPDVFDTLWQDNDGKGDKTEFNKSKTNTTLGSKKRKLFNPGSFSYLDDMRIVEQETPEIDSSRDVEKIPKKRTPRTKKPTQVASAGKKRKTPRKSGQLGIEVKKRRTKKTQTPGFSIDPTNFKSLDELFDKSCKDFPHRLCAHEYQAYNKGLMNHRPLDIICRAEPQNSSSDEIPGLENIRVGKKKVSRELPKRILDSKTPPHSSEYSWPDIEVEPLDLNNAEPSRKIKPKRLQNEELNNKTHKKPRLEIEESVPLPDFIGEVDSTQHNQDALMEKGTDFVGDVDSIHHSPDVPQGKDEGLLKESFKLIKFVIDLVEKKQDRHSLQKLKHLLTYAEKLKL